RSRLACWFELSEYVAADELGGTSLNHGCRCTTVDTNAGDAHLQTPPPARLEGTPRTRPRIEREHSTVHICGLSVERWPIVRCSTALRLIHLARKVVRLLIRD